MLALKTRLLSSAMAALAFLHSVQAASDNAKSADKNSPNYSRPVAGYVPTIAPAAIFFVLFGVLAVVSWIHYARRKMLVWLPIGLTSMSAGMAIRIGCNSNPWSIGIYSISTILTLLAPCAFLATCYQLLGRMANTLGGDVPSKCLFLKTSLITKIFVTSDIVTFLVQASGSSMQAIGSLSSIGHDLAMAGLIIQLVSFGLYCVLLVYFAFRVRSIYPNLWHRSEGQFTWSPRAVFARDQVDEWKVVFWSTVFGCIGLMVRCIFRVIEYAGGYNGAIATSEAYLYCLDSLPLVICMSAYVWFYPGRYLPDHVNSVSYGSDIEAGTPGSHEMLNSKGAQ